MERTLNRAFLRAFAQETGGFSPIPAPHAAFEPAPRAASPSASREQPASSGHRHAQRESLVAPQASTPKAAAADANGLAANEAWLMSDVSLVSALFSQAEIVVGTGLTAPSAPAATPAPAGPSAPAAAFAPQPLASAATPEAWPADWDDVGLSAEHHADHLVPQEEESESTETPATVESFAASWEVDRLAWPQECEQLYRQLSPAFDEAGEQLKAATLDGLRLLAVTSAFRGEGRTTLAMLLARAAARTGVRVALIDADLENPQLARQLKLRLEHDWRDILRQDLPASETAVASLEDGIVVFPLQRDARENFASVRDEELREFWSALAERFELVIVDWGPVEGHQRRLLPEKSVNAVMVVRDIRTTDAQHTDRVVRQLWGSRIEAVGIVENYVRDAA